MIGRQVLVTKDYLDLDSLEKFMKENWDTESYNQFERGKPTLASVEEYIMLPATNRFLVIVYGRKAGGLFSKDNKVVLSVCDAPGGIAERFATSIPSSNIFFGIWKISTVMSYEDERKGPAEEILQKYTENMRKLLSEKGYLK